jgi:7,8-dihydro-6-hydroxymethylpterin-pyrophosphokinase
MYITEQPPFLNAAILAETDLEPLQLLTALKQIEHQLGRQNRERFGAREIDLDVIDYNGPPLESESLVVPHPRATERRFVLEPICAIAPDWQLCGRSVSKWLEATDDQRQTVQLIEDAVLSIPRDPTFR